MINVCFTHTLHGLVRPSFLRSLKASRLVVRKSITGGLGFNVEGIGFNILAGEHISALLYVFSYSVFCLPDAGIEFGFTLE